MALKDVLKRSAKSGAKLAGKTLIKSTFDIKTLLIAYMAVLLTRGYGKLGAMLEREARLNQDAAARLEQKVSTEEGMKEVCDQYGITEVQVQQVIDMQRNIGDTGKAVMKTAQDQKKGWRRWLPGAKALTEKGAKDGLDLEQHGQLRLAMDGYAEAEAAERTNGTMRASERGSR